MIDPSTVITPPAVTPGVKPMTVVSPEVNVSVGEMEQRVVATRAQHGELLQQYHKVWYECDHSWVYQQFLGIGVMKSPNDLWAYHDLLTAFRPRTVIETGTYLGASALWFGFLMDMLQIDGHVYTVDFEDRRRCQHPRVTFLGGDSTDPALAAALLAQVEYPLLVSLDADHSAEHVRKELELFAPACRVGDWLVVEDTNIAWLGPDGDRGARGGLEDYMRNHPGEWRQDILSEKNLLTMHPGGWLQRMAACIHA